VLAEHVPPRADDASVVQDLQQRMARLEAQVGEGVEERIVSMSSRSVLTAIGILLGVVLVVGLLYLAWGAISLMLIALLAALGLNPAVEFFVGRGLKRGWATGLVFVLAIVAVGLLGLIIIPPMITQVTHAIDALPHTLADLSKGRGPFGFLEKKFHIVEQANKLTSGKSASGAATTVAGSGVSVALGVAGTLVGLVVIGFLTFFMLLEGPTWVERVMSVIPPSTQPRCRRIGQGISRTVGGFVTGNLLASLLAGTITAVVFLIAGLPYPVPIGVLVGALDLLPIFGALIAIVLVAVVAFFHGVLTGVIVTGILFLYHQFEVYYLRPVIYGRMIELSPLAVLVAAVIGTELAGPLGAIAAIPAAGAVQITLMEVLDARAQSRAHRRRRAIVDPPGSP
jgi:predicted PurR-regulated permease PerM